MALASGRACAWISEGVKTARQLTGSRGMAIGWRSVGQSARLTQTKPSTLHHDQHDTRTCAAPELRGRNRSAARCTCTHGACHITDHSVSWARLLSRHRSNCPARAESLDCPGRRVQRISCRLGIPADANSSRVHAHFRELTTSGVADPETTAEQLRSSRAASTPRLRIVRRAPPLARGRLLRVASSAPPELDLRDRLQAAVFAYESGLVRPGSATPVPSPPEYR